jgi:hypothetical protein
VFNYSAGIPSYHQGGFLMILAELRAGEPEAEQTILPHSMRSVGFYQEAPMAPRGSHCVFGDFVPKSGSLVQQKSLSFPMVNIS